MERSWISSINKKMKKNIIILLIVGLIAGGVFAYYMWNKPHRSSQNEKPAFNLTADSILLEFTNDENAATQKFLNKTVAVSGIVYEMKKDNMGQIEVILQTADPIETVNCVLANGTSTEGIVAGIEIELKGICSGYLSLSGVNLHQSVLNK